MPICTYVDVVELTKCTGMYIHVKFHLPGYIDVMKKCTYFDVHTVCGIRVHRRANRGNLNLKAICLQSAHTDKTCRPRDSQRLRHSTAYRRQTFFGENTYQQQCALKSKKMNKCS